MQKPTFRERLVSARELARRTASRALTVTNGDGSFAPARTAAVGPDGTVVALTASGRVARWKPGDGDRSICVDLSPAQNANPEVELALVTADGTLVTAPDRDGLRSDRPEAFVWKADGTLAYRLGGHGQRVTALASAASGAVATVSWDASLCTHVPRQLGAGIHWSSAPVANDVSNVRSMAFAPDDALFTVSSTGLICLFQRSADAWTSSGKREEPGVSVIAAGPDTDFITGGADGVVKLWPRELRDPCPARRIFTGHNGAVTAVAADPAGRIVSASQDGTVKVWQPSSGECLTTFVHPAPVRALSIAPNGDIVTCADDGVVRVWRCVSWTA